MVHRRSRSSKQQVTSSIFGPSTTPPPPPTSSWGILILGLLLAKVIMKTWSWFSMTRLFLLDIYLQAWSIRAKTAWIEWFGQIRAVISKQGRFLLGSPRGLLQLYHQKSRSWGFMHDRAISMISNCTSNGVHTQSRGAHLGHGGAYSKHRGANTISRRTFIDMKMTRSMYVSEFACGSGKMSYTLLLISKKWCI